MINKLKTMILSISMAAGLISLAAPCPALHAAALTPDKVMEAVDNREDGNTLTADTRMILINTWICDIKERRS